MSNIKTEGYAWQSKRHLWVKWKTVDTSEAVKNLMIYFYDNKRAQFPSYAKENAWSHSQLKI